MVFLQHIKCKIGFFQVVGVDTGGLKSERQEEMEFAHQFFVR